MLRAPAILKCDSSELSHCSVNSIDQRLSRSLNSMFLGVKPEKLFYSTLKSRFGGFGVRVQNLQSDK